MYTVTTIGNDKSISKTFSDIITNTYKYTYQQDITKQ